MVFTPREKPKNPGPVLKRDSNNRIIQSEADLELLKLKDKLKNEQRNYEKDISFMATTEKRDIYIFVTVGVRNSVDDKIAIGEVSGVNGWWRSGTEGDPYLYKNYDYVESYIPASKQPVDQKELGYVVGGIMKAIINYVAKMKGLKL
jgi:hypothetical protein